MHLADLWFIAIAVLWTGYFFLDGFDFGVGVLLPVVGRSEADRQAMIRTIGGVWDGNEVWFIVAAGATFAAFPLWYAAMFSGLYVPLLVILIALILRGVAFEFRGRRDSPAWRRTWDAALVFGSLVPAALWGLVFGNIVRGLPVDARFDADPGLGGLLNPYSLIGALTSLTVFVMHGAMFLRLRTGGELQVRARAVVSVIGPVAVLAAVALVVWIQLHRGSVVTAATAAVALAALLGAVLESRSAHSLWAFLLTGAAIIAGTATLFIALYPDVLPSTTNPAHSLTVQNASSSPYTLTIMTWVAGIFLPIVLLYQAWTYWVFARRIDVAREPREKVRRAMARH
ncbi:cytochrome d ubiquinol oxidase subunit II [Pseudonocardia sp.]|uniref:cytochrome d ubiquinol oxidase subunit II n=1 Tax=Pseudonocardia sp. TaxID=60912 RepID=UPI002618DC30|nr:cytochrome d ubiquinol oxidase subunit II [Pseudonocardia sp.]MCW2718742.1 cydB [Pseudonocardia sp.]